MAEESKGKSPKKSTLDSWIANNKRNRLFILGGSAVLGLLITPVLVPIIEYLLNCIAGLLGCPLFGNSDNKESLDRFRVNLSLLVISLPALLVLWWFRTYDTRQLIKESIKSRETSTYNNLLAAGLDLIASDSVPARCIGLVQLALVRRESPALEEQIDASTQDLTLYEEGKDGSEDVVIKLRGAMLENMNLRGAIMREAHLEGAYLNGVNLEGADLQGAHLEGAYLNGVNLERANLKGAHLEGAHLTHANLTHAYLNGANLKRAELERAIMVEAQLQKLDIQRNSLEKAQYEQTCLEGANLKGAHLEEADLDRAILIGADLRKSNLPLELSLKWLSNLMKELLPGYDRGGANLERANLRGADLEGTLWKAANFKDATYDDDTNLPDGLIAKEQGLTKDG